MTTLTHADLTFVLSRTPKDVRDILVKHHLYLAGGFIRATISGERPSDIDLFGPSEQCLTHAAMELAVARKAKVSTSNNAITLLAPPRHPVQLITRWVFDDPGRLVESFDYTVARACVWHDGQQWRSCCDPAFYPDQAARRLVYCAPIRDEDSGGSLLRARKFLAKGYTIQAPSLAGVAARLMKGIDPALLADEAALAKALLGRLHEVDPLTVIDGCEIVDEHQVAGA